jgi:hypothetical protein
VRQFDTIHPGLGHCARQAQSDLVPQLDFAFLH